MEKTVKNNSQLSSVNSLLPKGWDIKKLGDLCEVLDKLRKPITKKDRIAGNYPYYGATGILGYVHDFIFNEKLILIGEDGAKWNSGDRSSFTVKGKYWVNNHAHVIKPHRDIILDNWIVYFLNFSDLSKYITGLTVPKLNQGKLKSIEIPVPPLPEQQRIVEILDKAFVAIDKAKQNAEQNLRNVNAVFESYLNGVFENKGDDWEEKKLGKLGILTSSKRIYKKEYVDNGVPFYRSKEIKELGNNKNITLELFITEERYTKIKQKFGVPAKGDILLTAVGTIGEMYVVKENDKFYFKDGNIIWLKNFKSLNTYYLKYALTSFVEKLKALSRGAAYSALTIEKLKEYSITVPPIATQKQIVNKLDKLSAETKKLEVIYQQKIANLAELKKSILQKAFSGEL